MTEDRGATTRREGGAGRPRDPAADAAILSAAVELLVERGVDQTSIEQVAKRAGVAKVTVYRRWRSKEELLAHAIEAARDEIPDTTTAGHPDRPLSDVVEELLPQWAELLAQPRFRALAARLLGAGPSHPKLLEAYWRYHVGPRRDRARAAVVQAQTRGMLAQSADVDVLIDMIAGAVIQHLLLAPQPRTAAEVEDYLRRLLRQVGVPLPGT